MPTISIITDGERGDSVRAKLNQLISFYGAESGAPYLAKDGSNNATAVLNYNTDVSAGFGALSLINKAYADARYLTGGTYLPLGGGTLTGTLVLNADATTGKQATTYQQLIALANMYLPLAGGTLTGTLVLNADATTGKQATTYQQLIALANLYLPLTGGTLTGNLNGVTPTQISYLSGATSNIQNQLNNLMIGIGGWKAAARVMSNTNINVSSAPSSIDGVTLSNGDRVVLNAQTTGTQNGVYVFNGAASAMTRATDCSTGDYSNTGVLGMVITIEEGTYADQMWLLSNNAVITIGTTSLTYIKGSNTTYTGSNGITLSGNNFVLDNTYFSGDATISTGVISIGAGKVLNSMLGGSIAASKLVGTDIATVGTITAGIWNSRTKLRVGTEATNTATSINTDNYDVWTITALASADTITATGTPNDGQKLIIRIKDNATARALTFNSIFRFSTSAPAPATTTISKTMYIGFSYNAADSKWDCISPFLDNF